MARYLEALNLGQCSTTGGFNRIGARALLAAALSFISLFALSSTAHAQYKVCNETSYAIQTAVAGKEAGELISRGWTTVFPGFCETLIAQPLKESTYYLHGRSAIGHLGPMRHWAGDVGFCIKPGDFEIKGEDNCEKRGYQEAMFDVIETGRSKSWETTFTEPENYGLKKAGILGTQRLLADLGYMNKKRIDGYAGPGTRRAIRKFARAYGTKFDSEPSKKLFRALLKSAQERASTAGFEICNQSEHGIWAAIGVPLDKAVNTKGWYELQPEQCVKPVLAKLNKDFMYVYAESSDTAPKKMYWRGDESLCANDIVFSLTTLPGECKEEGLKALKFRKIDTEGREKWTHFITDDTSTSDQPF